MNIVVPYKPSQNMQLPLKSEKLTKAGLKEVTVKMIAKNAFSVGQGQFFVPGVLVGVVEADLRKIRNLINGWK